VVMDGVHITPIVTHGDERGFFREVIRTTDATFAGAFGQLSHSLVHAGILKAWHGHRVQTQWTYVACGLLQLVMHDARPASPTHGQRIELLAGDGQAAAIYRLPAGVVHGYRVLSGPAHVIYVTSGTYDPEDEVRVPHDDPAIGYDWTRPHDRR
jgi:dTDP-4-dehydrorhamnose 3,5-epimerase